MFGYQQQKSWTHRTVLLILRFWNSCIQTEEGSSSEFGRSSAPVLLKDIKRFSSNPVSQRQRPGTAEGSWYTQHDEGECTSLGNRKHRTTTHLYRRSTCTQSGSCTDVNRDFLFWMSSHHLGSEAFMLPDMKRNNQAAVCCRYSFFVAVVYKPSSRWRLCPGNQKEKLIFKAKWKLVNTV